MTEDLVDFVRKALTSVRAMEAGVTAEDISQAPHLDHWLPVRDRYGAAVLWGEVSGHPKLGDGSIQTAPLIGLNIERGWAYSCSRLYRLGVPLFQITDELAAHFRTDRADIVFTLDAGARQMEELEDVQRLISILVAHVRRRAREFGIDAIN